MDGVSRRSKLTLPLGISVAAYLIHALSYRFVCDDAFISFRYARNLVEHGELAYNLGERVEGISNPLWTLLISVGLVLGLDPVIWTQGIGLLAGLAVLFRLHWWMRQSWVAIRPVSSEKALSALWNDGWSALPVLFLAAAPGFAAWTTGGLETTLFTLFFTLAWTDWWRDRAVPAGLWIGLCGLTRPEGSILIAPLVIHGVFFRMGFASVARLVCATGAVLLPALLARYAYYGHWLPNTVYAKAPAADLLGSGLYYLWRWVHVHGLYVLPIAGWWLWSSLRRWDRARAQEARSMVFLSLGILATFCAIIVSVGGDFMVLGRYLVPLLPLIAVLVACGGECMWERVGPRDDSLPGGSPVDRARGHRLSLAAPLLLMILAGGAVIQRASVLKPYTSRGLASIGWLSQFVQQGEAIGAWLRATQAPGTRMAITAAGTIPFDTDFWTLDMLGLNDAWIARNAASEGTRPGHRKHAPLEYLLEAELDVIVAHPTITESPSWPAAGMRDEWAKRGFEWKSVRVPDLEPEWFGYWQRVQ
ncbi:MAG: hypothetical protein AAGG01_14805 [Planctomycetota bacterium]